MFSFLYSSAEVRGSNRDFYLNQSKVFDHYLKWWAVMADYFKHNDYVIGYDIMNEVYPDTLKEEEQADMMPPQFDTTILQPLYQKISTSIRTVDKHKILFFQPSRIPDILPKMGGNVQNTALDNTPGGRSFKQKTAMSEHFYCCEGHPTGCQGELWYGQTQPIGDDICRTYLKHMFQKRTEDSTKLEVPLFISEFGACWGTSSCIKEIDFVLDMADHYGSSWTYYQFKGFGDYAH